MFPPISRQREQILTVYLDSRETSGENHEMQIIFEHFQSKSGLNHTFEPPDGAPKVPPAHRIGESASRFFLSLQFQSVFNLRRFNYALAPERGSMSPRTLDWPKGN